MERDRGREEGGGFIGWNLKVIVCLNGLIHSEG
jgi:hypothetical protein